MAGVNQYLIQKSDSTKDTFAIEPFSMNGPGQLFQDTSLLLPGKGKFEYGQIMAENLVWLLENFANSTVPSNPIQGQLWFDNTALTNQLNICTQDIGDPGDPGYPLAVTFNQVAVAGLPMSASLDLGGTKLLNVGDADPLDLDYLTQGLNVGYADSLYVKIAGDTMTGDLSFATGPSTVTNLPTPVDPGDAANKNYVDTVAGAAGVGIFVQLIGDTMTGALTLSGNPVNALHAAPKQYVDLRVLKSGDTMSGPLTVNGIGSVLVDGTLGVQLNGGADLVLANGDFSHSGVGSFTIFNGITINVDSNTITNVAAPVLGTDAANKNYVDDRMFRSGDTMTGLLVLSSDPVVPLGAATKQYVDAAIAGSGGLEYGIDNTPTTLYLPTTGDFTFARPLGSGQPNVLLSIANTRSSVFKHDIDLSPPTSYLRDQLIDDLVDYPLASHKRVFDLFDSAMSALTAGPYRMIDDTTADGNVGTFSTGFTFTPESNKLMVFVNGVKQYANTRGYSRIHTPAYTHIGNVTALGAGNYVFGINPDGAGNTDITVALLANPTIHDIVTGINAALATQYTAPLAPVVVFNGGFFTFYSATTGASSSVAITIGSGALRLFDVPNLNGSISTQPAGKTFAYTEDGSPFFAGTSVTFATSGYQIVNVGGAKTGASTTGLANNATVYTATITVDGVVKNISVVGSAAQTYTTLLAEINTDLGASATATLSGGNIKVTSATTSPTSTVAIADVDLFSTLTGYVSILTAVPGAGTAPLAGSVIEFIILP